ncbi:MAG TPA: hypothetical protein VIM70_01715 [Clostridium sp.]|uniref:hypothetical protein n=1 Tax=Clostridium sp. TaxID=1506 RepID=UPI002F923DB9
MSGISKWVLKWAKTIILISCLVVILFELFISGDYSITIINKKNKTNYKIITQHSDFKNILDRDKDKLCGLFEDDTKSKK